VFAGNPRKITREHYTKKTILPPMMRVGMGEPEFFQQFAATAD
jgi:hypothetical protein